MENKSKFLRVKQEIEKQHLSVRKAAIMANITPSDLYAALKEQKPFFKGWRVRLAAALGVNEEELFKGVDDDE